MVLSGVACLASKFDCSNLGSFRDMTFIMFYFYFQKIKLIFFSKFEKPNPVVGDSQGTLSGCLSCLNL